VTVLALDAGDGGIAVGPDGVAWFTQNNFSLGRITPTGTITQYPIPGNGFITSSIATSTDGSVWFGESQVGRPGSSSINTIYSMTPSGVATAHATKGQPATIVAGQDGSILFTEASFSLTNIGNYIPGGSWIGRIDSSGNLTEYSVSGGQLIEGPDGAIWYTTSGGIARMTVDGVVTATYPLGNLTVTYIVAGSDGAIWFSDPEDNLIARMTTAGTITQYPLPTPNSSPGVLAATPDGAIWFTETTGFGRLAFPSVSQMEISSSPSLLAGTVGTRFTQVLTVAGGTPPYQWSSPARPLPTGLTLFSTAGGAGSATATISGVPASSGLQTFSITVTDATGLTNTQTFTVNISPVSCSYSINPPSLQFPAAGGSGSFAVNVAAGCQWTVTPPAGGNLGIALTGGNSGNGDGIVTFVIPQNFTTSFLSGTLTVANVSVNITQNSALIGTMPHLIAQEGWTNTFTLINKGNSATSAALTFLGNNGTPLFLSATLPQQSSAATITPSLTQTIGPNASLIVETSIPSQMPLLPQSPEGTAQVLSTGDVDGFAIFHYNPSGQEAVVPLGGSGTTIPFDNTNGVSTGIAVENALGSSVIPVALFDDTGLPIGTGTESITLSASNHTSFVLATQFPVTANIRGTIVLGGCPAAPTSICPKVSALGIRYTPPGTLTTIPTLGQGGELPHIASGNGWQTTFVLFNNGSATAPKLNFFDDNGNPLALPLTFPQTGATVNASSVSQSIPPNGTLWIQSGGDLGTALLTGSAQLTNAGSVGGFAIFRYNPNGQEAVVPLESRNPNSYLIAFDNTNGTATGIALSVSSTQAVSVPYVIRDDTGAQIGAGTIPLAANGHTSFMLASQLPPTAGIRGTVEFDALVGTQISVLGIRSPPALTFTTLPALAQ
jgi:streptogramin lyase